MGTLYSDEGPEQGQGDAEAPPILFVKRWAEEVEDGLIWLEF